MFHTKHVVNRCGESPQLGNRTQQVNLLQYTTCKSSHYNNTRVSYTTRDLLANVSCGSPDVRVGNTRYSRHGYIDSPKVCLCT